MSLIFDGVLHRKSLIPVCERSKKKKVKKKRRDQEIETSEISCSELRERTNPAVVTEISPPEVFAVLAPAINVCNSPTQKLPKCSLTRVQTSPRIYKAFKSPTLVSSWMKAPAIQTCQPFFYPSVCLALFFLHVHLFHYFCYY